MREYLARVAELQSEIALGLTYLIVVLPVWALLRIARRTLLEPGPRWHRSDAPRSIDDLRRPF